MLYFSCSLVVLRLSRKSWSLNIRDGSQSENALNLSPSHRNVFSLELIHAAQTRTNYHKRTTTTMSSDDFWIVFVRDLQYCRTDAVCIWT